MSELRDTFKSKDFIINSNIIKCISSLDINLKEFLLVLYFINVSPVLDSDDIKNKLGLSDEDVVENFSSLLNKKYIELDVSSDNGVVTEKIKLDPLYDRLVMNINTEKNNSDIYSMFENEFGRTLSPMEYEKIKEWISNNSKEMITLALKEAVLNGVSNLNYIDSILNSWKKKGYKNKEDILKDKEEYRTKKEKVDVFETDWLND
jgi:DNA replication protein